MELSAGSEGIIIIKWGRTGETINREKNDYCSLYENVHPKKGIEKEMEKGWAMELRMRNIPANQVQRPKHDQRKVIASGSFMKEKKAEYADRNVSLGSNTRESGEGRGDCGCGNSIGKSLSNKKKKIDIRVAGTLETCGGREIQKKKTSRQKNKENITISRQLKTTR